MGFYTRRVMSCLANPTPEEIQQFVLPDWYPETHMSPGMLVDSRIIAIALSDRSVTRPHDGIALDTSNLAGKETHIPLV
jgi:hypothetical protein